MKSLIYTVALGHPVYSAMARECVASARRNGYAGEFLVLTDDTAPVTGATRVALKAVPTRLAKAGLTQALDPAAIAAHEKVLYVDADCVFTRHPAALLAHEGLRFAIETDGPYPRYNTIFFTPRERAAFRMEGVPRLNTGTILLPGHCAAEILEAWEAFWYASPRASVRRQQQWRWCNPALMDQPAMQLMLFRSGHRWEGFPSGTVGFPVYERDIGGVALLHFCGPLNDGRSSHLKNKEALLERMRAVSENQIE